MSKKKRRRRPRPSSEARTPVAAAAGPARVKGSPRAEEPSRGGWLRRSMQPREQAPSLLPPFGVSLAQGLRAVGRSPLVLALALLGTLGIWAVFAVLGAELSPRAMVNLMALPPVPFYFDVILVTGLAESALAAGATVLGVAVGRALLVGAITLRLLDALGQDGAPALRSLARLPRLAGTLFLLFSVEIAAMLSIPVIVQSIGGPGLGLLGVLGALILGLHFLGMVPVVAAADRTSAAETLRRSIRAARLPGPRHLVLVVAYFSFVFWAATITPTEAVAPATPSVLTWAFTLLATVLHTAALGAFAFRWLAVRERLPEPAPRRRRA